MSEEFDARFAAGSAAAVLREDVNLCDSQWSEELKRQNHHMCASESCGYNVQCTMHQQSSKIHDHQIKVRFSFNVAGHACHVCDLERVFAHNIATS
jgi:hypothetical protein